MPRFTKTRIHPASAVLFLLSLYSIAGLIYAATMHSMDSVAVWAVTGILALIAGLVWQTHIARKRARG